MEADYTAALAAIPTGTAKTRGIALGHAAAAAILALRSADGFDVPPIDPTYQEGTAPGEYRYTPGTPFAFAPHWGEVTPFVLKDSSQFRPGPPYSLTSRKYAADVNEVKRLGGDGVTTPSARTADQTQIARFWVESSPLQWNRLTRSVATAKHLDLWESARLYGVQGCAHEDSTSCSCCVPGGGGASCERDGVEIGARRERRHRVECECGGSGSGRVLPWWLRATGSTHVRDGAGGRP